MNEKYLELNPFEVGYLTGLIVKEIERNPEDEPILKELKRKLMDIAEIYYRQSGGDNGNLQRNDKAQEMA